jgi:hypothetical protein
MTLTQEQIGHLVPRSYALRIEDVHYALYSDDMISLSRELRQYGRGAEMPTDQFLSFCFENNIKVVPIPLSFQDQTIDADLMDNLKYEMSKFDKLGLLPDENLMKSILQFHLFIMHNPDLCVSLAEDILRG